jgi:alpha-amylase
MKNFSFYARAKKFLMCLFIVTAGVSCWISCAPEEEAIVPSPNSEIQTTESNDKAGSSAVMIQTFTLFTEKWPDIQAKASAWGSAGFTMAWLPPASRAADNYGYLPTQWYDYNNWRGSSAQLSSCINAVKSNGMMAIADVVLNHRNGNATAGADFVNPAFANNAAAVTSSDECGCGTGGSDQGNDFNGGRDLNHNNASVVSLSKSFVSSLAGLGFGGGRYDMVLGYSASAASGYKLGSFQVGEYWVDDRNAINNWANTAGMNAFDFTTYNRLRTAVAGNYSVLGSVPGLIGINKGRAVTFAGNHDTPSSGLIGLVYIMTHPGIPCVGVEDWYAFSNQIRTLIGIRKAQGIGQTSSVAVQTATSSVYAAIIDGKVAMKIGPGSWSPSGSWTLATSGTNYAIWTAGGGGGGNVTVTLRMLKDVGAGNSIFFTGNNATLTNWGTGTQGTWNTGNYWTKSITVPSGTTIEYKVRRGPTGGAGSTWESGANHVITNPANGTTYTATFQGGF